MARPRIKWKSDGLRKLRSAPGVVSDLESRGKRVQDAAASMGGKYRMDSQQGAANPQGRWRVSITTDDFTARRKNAKHLTLLRALDAGR